MGTPIAVVILFVLILGFSVGVVQALFRLGWVIDARDPGLHVIIRLSTCCAGSRWGLPLC